uniref:MFS domain-containing protein n=1 Tax=Ascaris lumbricoides TaxID=6252 RepID=A0A0M3IVZ1_ASCLU
MQTCISLAGLQQHIAWGRLLPVGYSDSGIRRQCQRRNRLVVLDEDADLHFFGWITAAYSLGQIIASWVFGFWNQKTMSTTQPACCGLAFMALGNTLYAILPQLPIHHKWLMLFARLLVGFGSGNLTVLRTYCAMASVQKDRAKAMSLAVGSFVLGLSIGPAIQDEERHDFRARSTIRKHELVRKSVFEHCGTTSIG